MASSFLSWYISVFVDNDLATTDISEEVLLDKTIIHIRKKLYITDADGDYVDFSDLYEMKGTNRLLGFSSVDTVIEKTFRHFYNKTSTINLRNDDRFFDKPFPTFTNTTVANGRWYLRKQNGNPANFETTPSGMLNVFSSKDNLTKVRVAVETSIAGYVTPVEHTLGTFVFTKLDTNLGYEAQLNVDGLVKKLQKTTADSIKDGFNNWYRFRPISFLVKEILLKTFGKIVSNKLTIPIGWNLPKFKAVIFTFPKSVYSLLGQAPIQKDTDSDGEPDEYLQLGLMPRAIVYSAEHDYLYCGLDNEIWKCNLADYNWELIGPIDSGTTGQTINLIDKMQIYRYNDLYDILYVWVRHNTFHYIDTKINAGTAHEIKEGLGVTDTDLRTALGSCWVINLDSNPVLTAFSGYNSYDTEFNYFPSIPYQVFRFRDASETYDFNRYAIFGNYQLGEDVMADGTGTDAFDDVDLPTYSATKQPSKLYLLNPVHVRGSFKFKNYAEQLLLANKNKDVSGGLTYTDVVWIETYYTNNANLTIPFKQKIFANNLGNNSDTNIYTENPTENPYQLVKVPSLRHANAQIKYDYSGTMIVDSNSIISLDKNTINTNFDNDGIYKKMDYQIGKGYYAGFGLLRKNTGATPSKTYSQLFGGFGNYSSTTDIKFSFGQTGLNKFQIVDSTTYGLVASINFVYSRPQELIKSLWISNTYPRGDALIESTENQFSSYIDDSLSSIIPYCSLTYYRNTGIGSSLTGLQNGGQDLIYAVKNLHIRGAEFQPTNWVRPPVGGVFWTFGYVNSNMNGRQSNYVNNDTYKLTYANYNVFPPASTLIPENFFGITPMQDSTSAAANLIFSQKSQFGFFLRMTDSKTTNYDGEYPKCKSAYHTVHLTPANVKVDDTFTAIINGTTINVYATAPTVANVVGLLISAINSSGVAATVTATDSEASGEYVIVTADAAGIVFTCTTETDTSNIPDTQTLTTTVIADATDIEINNKPKTVSTVFDSTNLYFRIQDPAITNDTEAKVKYRNTFCIITDQTSVNNEWTVFIYEATSGNSGEANLYYHHWGCKARTSVLPSIAVNESILPFGNFINSPIYKIAEVYPRDTSTGVVTPRENKVVLDSVYAVDEGATTYLFIVELNLNKIDEVDQYTISRYNIAANTFEVVRSFMSQPKNLVLGSPNRHLYFTLEGEGKVCSIDTTFELLASVTASYKILGNSDSFVIDEFFTHGNITVVEDPSDSRLAKVYGFSSPNGLDRYQGKIDIGKFYLWQLSQNYLPIVELADFSGMFCDQALDSLFEAIYWTKGFDEDGNFFSLPRVLEDDASLTLDTGISAKYVNLKKSVNYDDIANKVSIVPYKTTIKLPSIDTVLRKREDAENTTLQLIVDLEQRDTLTKDISLICVKEGAVGGRHYDLITGLTTTSSDSLQTDGEDPLKLVPLFKFSIIDPVIEVRIIQEISAVATSAILSSVFGGATNPSGGVQVNDYIQFFNETTEETINKKITAVDSDTNTVTLDSALGYIVTTGTICKIIKVRQLALDTGGNSTSRDYNFSDEGLTTFIGWAVATKEIDVVDNEFIGVKNVIGIVDANGVEERCIVMAKSTTSDGVDRIMVDRVITGTYDSSSKIRVYWSPLLSNNLYEVGGSKVFVKLVAKDYVNGENNFERSFLVGDSFLIKCEGLSLVSDPQSTTIKIDATSVKAYGEIEFPGNIDNKFVNRQLAQYLAQILVDEHSTPRYEIEGDAIFLPMLHFLNVEKNRLKKVRIISEKLFPIHLDNAIDFSILSIKQQPDGRKTSFTLRAENKID